MALGGNDDIDTGIVDGFFARARLAAGDRSFKIEGGEAEIGSIAIDAALRASFRAKYRQLNDPDLQASITDYLGELIIPLEAASDRSDIRVDLIDRAALTPSIAILVAGLVSLAGTGGMAAPFLLAAGLAGAGASAGSRSLLKSAAYRGRLRSKHVRLLLESLQ